MPQLWSFRAMATRGPLQRTPCPLSTTQCCRPRMPGFKSQLHDFLELFNFSVPWTSQEWVPTLQNYSYKWIYVKPLEQYNQYLDKNKCCIGVINQMLFWDLTQPFFFHFEETSDTGKKQWVSQGPRETASHWVKSLLSSLKIWECGEAMEGTAILLMKSALHVR